MYTAQKLRGWRRIFRPWAWISAVAVFGFLPAGAVLLEHQWGWSVPHPITHIWILGWWILVPLTGCVGAYHKDRAITALGVSALMGSTCIGTSFVTYFQSAVWLVSPWFCLAACFFPFAFATHALTARFWPRFNIYFHHPLQCSQCGYNLAGNVSGRCPECGRNLTRGQRRWAKRPCP